MTDKPNLTVLNGKSKKKSEDTELEQRGHYRKMDDIVQLLDGRREHFGVSYLIQELGELPHYYCVVRKTPADSGVVCLRVDKKTNICAEVSFETIRDVLIAHLGIQRDLVDGFQYSYTPTKIKELVEHWRGRTVNVLNEMPPSVLFKSSSDVCFYRLPFDPNKEVTDTEILAFLAPTWHEISTRMDNFDAFAARVASLFIPEADRKQAVYVWGPKDCGKSQIMSAIQRLMGYPGANCSSTVLSNTELKEQFWKAKLIGKRLVVVAESTIDFCNRAEFKAITGDKIHSVRKMYKGAVDLEIDSIFAFFSNDKPEIDSKPDLMERLIVCTVSSLPPDVQLLPEKDYQEKLVSEFAAFVGYGMNLYDKCKNGRIPCDRAILEMSVDDRESDALDLFGMCFEIDKNSEVVKEKALATVREASQCAITEREFKRLMTIWSRRYGVVGYKKGVRLSKDKITSRYFYRGISILHPDERSFTDL